MGTDDRHIRIKVQTENSGHWYESLVCIGKIYRFAENFVSYENNVTYMRKAIVSFVHLHTNWAGMINLNQFKEFAMSNYRTTIILSCGI
jgi:hypothetical protein